MSERLTVILVTATELGPSRSQQAGNGVTGIGYSATLHLRRLWRCWPDLPPLISSLLFSNSCDDDGCTLHSGRNLWVVWERFRGRLLGLFDGPAPMECDEKRASCTCYPRQLRWTVARKILLLPIFETVTITSRYVYNTLFNHDIWCLYEASPRYEYERARTL
jgi:hypothetical protein